MLCQIPSRSELFSHRCRPASRSDDSAVPLSIKTIGMYRLMKGSTLADNSLLYCRKLATTETGIYSLSKFTPRPPILIYSEFCSPTVGPRTHQCYQSICRLLLESGPSRLVIPSWCGMSRPWSGVYITVHIVRGGTFDRVQ